MSLAVAIQMDPIDAIDINGDSTFALALEAQSRGHGLFHYLPQDLSLREGRVIARARPLQVRREEGNHFTLGEAETLDLTGVDVVLMRQDPPFDMSYITATHILEHVHPQTLVVNDPVSVRNAPEKLFVTHFDGVTPPTLITSSRAEIEAFRAKHKDIIVKPLYGNGGAGVFHITPDDENLNSLIEMFEGLYREPFIVQRYLPEVRDGDKRIILVDGEPVGAINRVPAEGEARFSRRLASALQRPCEGDARNLIDEPARDVQHAAVIALRESCAAAPPIMARATMRRAMVFGRRGVVKMPVRCLPRA